MKQFLSSFDDSKGVPTAKLNNLHFKQRATNDEHGGMVISFLKDSARDLDEVKPSLAFIQAKVNHSVTEKVIVDPGSGLEIVTKAFVRKAKLIEVALPRPMLVELADGKPVLVTNFVGAQMLVGEVISDFHCLVMGESAAFDVIVGITWCDDTTPF